MIFTGVLESITRETAEELAKQYGAVLSKSVGKTLDYAVVGEEAGPSKLEKIAQLKIKTLGMDSLQSNDFLILASSSSPPSSPSSSACPFTR